jgi:NAD-dependent SIR2 family protein deacetylase
VEGIKENIPDEAIQKLRGAKRLAVLTGAGVSAESGVPTFRGKDGLWKNHQPQQLATPQAFEKDPELVWDWYHWRRKVVLEVLPNPAHYAIAELECTCGREVKGSWRSMATFTTPAAGNVPPSRPSESSRGW